MWKPCLMGSHSTDGRVGLIWRVWSRATWPVSLFQRPTVKPLVSFRGQHRADTSAWTSPITVWSTVPVNKSCCNLKRKPCPDGCLCHRKSSVNSCYTMSSAGPTLPETSRHSLESIMEQDPSPEPTPLVQPGPLLSRYIPVLSFLPLFSSLMTKCHVTASRLQDWQRITCSGMNSYKTPAQYNL